jgi:hypothetical protein
MKKTTIVRAAMIGLMSLTFSAAPVVAQPGGYYLYTYEYYSDATKTQQVGFQVDHCYQPASISGQVTPYYNRYRTGYYSYSEGCTEY